MAQKNSYAAMFKDAETEWGRDVGFPGHRLGDELFGDNL